MTSITALQSRDYFQLSANQSSFSLSILLHVSNNADAGEKANG
jgi:hypothetical protein